MSNNVLNTALFILNKMTKINYKKKSIEELHQIRKQVVELYLKNESVAQIMCILNVSRHIVNTAIKRYGEVGETALKPLSPGKSKGDFQLLSKQQQSEICTTIFTKRPKQIGMKDRFLWSRELVWEFIKQKYDIALSERGLAKYLKLWGLKLKFTRNIKRCSRQTRKWLEENYSKLKKQEELENARIFWVFRIAKLNADLIESDIQVISFVNNQGKIYWLGIKKPFSANKQISAIKALIKTCWHRIFLIRSVSNLLHSGDTLTWLKNNNECDVRVFPREQIASNNPKHRHKSPIKNLKNQEDDDWDDDY